MSSASEPALVPLWPNIAPNWDGKVILTLPVRSNFAECSWLARCAAAPSACSGVSALASGEAQAARATIVNKLARMRFIGLFEYIGGVRPFPSADRSRPAIRVARPGDQSRGWGRSPEPGVPPRGAATPPG